MAGISASALLLLLAGCSATPKAINPVSWWHGLEGGAIAQDRPPPPKANAPYPHIGNAPQRPAGMPDWEWQELQATLASQAAAAHQYAADNPIPTLPQSPGATPATPAAKPASAAAAAKPAPAPVAQTQAQAPAQSSADQEAIRRLANAQGPNGATASTPPAATVAAASAASAPNQGQGQGSGSAVTFDTPDSKPNGQGPKEVPVNAQGQVPAHYKTFDANNGLSVPGALGPVAQPDELHPPALPTGVPAPAAVPGFAIPAMPSTYVPPKVVAQPAPFVPPAPLPNVPPVPVTFLPGSAILSPPMQRALHNLIYARQGHRIAVTGYGNAADASPEAQAAAMPLALERARAITVQLMAFGLPQSQIAPGAAAQGQGGLARLVN